MNCPRCESVILTEREREGLVVDACGVCRGIWLDRGELEKLITRAVREFDELAPIERGPPFRLDRSRDDDDDDDDRRPKRKRRWIDSLGDIFD